MKAMKAGVTKAGKGIDNLVWNILGQTYVPKQVSENSFAWHATFPPGTFVPPHIHPTQDEFIYMFEGEVVYGHADKLYTLQPGDSLFFDADAPHGPDELTKLPMTYLSIIIYTRD